MAAHFLQMYQWDLRSLKKHAISNFQRIASYFDFVLCLHDSLIISAILSGIFLLRIVSLIIEQLAVSSLVIVGVSLVRSMPK